MLLDVHAELGGDRRHGAGRPRRAPQPPPAAVARSARWPTPWLRRCSRAPAAAMAASIAARPPGSGPGRAPAVRVAASARLVALRCVYTDLDGTLLGRGGIAVSRRRGRLHAAAGACARGLPPRRRGGGDQVRPPQGAGHGGRAPARPELLHLRGGLGPGDRRRGDLAHRRASAGRRQRRVHELIERTGRPGAAAASATRAASSTTRPGTWTARSRTCSAAVDEAEANELLAARGARDLRLVDNGGIERGPARLPPDPGRRRRRRTRWPRTCRRAATRPSTASRSATRARTSTWRAWSAASSWWATRASRAAGRTWRSPSPGYGDGFYEAVIRSLAEAR